MFFKVFPITAKCYLILCDPSLFSKFVHKCTFPFAYMKYFSRIPRMKQPALTVLFILTKFLPHMYVFFDFIISIFYINVSFLYFSIFKICAPCVQLPFNILIVILHQHFLVLHLNFHCQFWAIADCFPKSQAASGAAGIGTGGI